MEMSLNHVFSDPEREILTMRFNEDDSLLALGNFPIFCFKNIVFRHF